MFDYYGFIELLMQLAVLDENGEPIEVRTDD